MYWNEKIELVKQRYSDKEFSVPNVNRKRILREIEVQFISRSADYYQSNSFNTRFANWWDNIKQNDQKVLTSKQDLTACLSELINPNDTFWIAAEFVDGIMIYKTKKDAALYLMSIGRTWVNTYHMIHLKFKYLISFRIEASTIEVKRSGEV